MNLNEECLLQFLRNEMAPAMPISTVEGLARTADPASAHHRGACANARPVAPRPFNGMAEPS